jgi:hypothetical protein
LFYYTENQYLKTIITRNKMEKLISCCGLNCAGCDARIATMNDDNELRTATAEKWKAMYDAPGLSAEMINCTGCREAGVKFDHCYKCEIRNCAQGRGFETCGECPEMGTCNIVAPVHQYVPEAIENLRSLN